MIYSVCDIAKYVISYSQKCGYLITNARLQKLLYFIQAEFLVETGQPCFFEEIEAWDFGVVIPIVYHEYKIFGNYCIVSNTNDVFLNNDDQERIDDVVDECAKYSTAELIKISKNQLPWMNVYQRYKTNVITKESILEFFAN